MTDFQKVDWSRLPKPKDDGEADHLIGMVMPDVSLQATTGDHIVLSELNALTVLYAYPMTGTPGIALPDGWDNLPGARGCTPQACSFRDHANELRALGVGHIFGVSTQPSEDQAESVERLHLPFALLSDANFELTKALRLPNFSVDGHRLLKRLTLIIRDGRIVETFYPVFPPDEAPAQVLKWLSTHSPAIAAP